MGPTQTWVGPTHGGVTLPVPLLSRFRSPPPQDTARARLSLGRYADAQTLGGESPLSGLGEGDACFGF